jgi:hypothetical protein
MVEEATKGIVDEFHKDIGGGHHDWRDTTYKILRASYYWPKLFFEVNAKVRSCKECHFLQVNKNFLLYY